MKRLALLLIALALAGAAHAAPAAPNGPCPVTVHVSNAGAFSLSNCKGARKTTEKAFTTDLKAMLAQAEGDSVIFDAGPEASLRATATAMNLVQDSGVYTFEIVDEPGRPAFMISMPPVNFFPVDAAPGAAPRAPRPHLVSVTVRQDHLLDVYGGRPLRPEGQALALADPKSPEHFITTGATIDTLALSMPAASPEDMAVLHGQDARWRETRAVYRIFAAAGLGRLISEDPSLM